MEDHVLGKFHDRIIEIAKSLGIDCFVMLVDVGDDREVFRYPDCAPDCPDRAGCASRIFTVASEDFARIAKRIESGHVKEVTRKPAAEA